MLLSDAVFPRFTSDLLRPAFALSFLAASSCHYPKPPAAWTGAQPPPPSAAPVVVAPAPTPPPPPPKCEDLKEHCTATPDTKLLVGDGGSWFTPPEGWQYARSSGGSIAVHPDGTALVMLMPSPDPSDLAPAVEAIVTEHGVKGLKVEKLKRRLKKPQQSLPAGEGSVDLWEVDKSQQGEALSLRDKGNGTLLVLVGKPAPERTLLGIGFVVEAAAETEAPKIMQSVQTLRGKP
ncbi:MAG: hypothetical protein K0R38_1200 [Polyangiaceae bacterium]|jgi:hypothetical protein|nr:hypothetical protein [Polyangiaceae bacterium]